MGGGNDTVNDAARERAPNRAAPAAVDLHGDDGLPMPLRAWAIASVALAIAMCVLDSSIANVALPVIARQFGASPADSVWIVNAYQLATVVSLLPLASLGEIVGYRRIYLAGLSVFTLASLACALSRSLEMLTFARMLQGFGAAGVMSVNGALVRFIYPGRLLGRGVGLNAMVVSVTAAIGPSVAAAILAVGPWPWLFAVNIPVGLAALTLAARVLPANQLSGRPFDWLSALLNALTFGLVIGGIDTVTRTAAKAWGVLELGIGVAAGALLARREWSRPRPLVPFDLLRERTFALSVMTSIASFAAQMLAFVSLPFHFENSLHRSQVETGLLLTPWPAAVAVAAPLAGRLADRVSSALLSAIGLVALSAGMTALALLKADASSFDIGWRMVLCGAGFGFFQAPNNRMMLTAAPRERAGAAGGMLGTARLTGQTTGAVLTAIALGWFGARGEVTALALGAAFAFVAAGFSALRLAPFERR
jgi:DHA2 family multidrug resistance protein-like MFS transporter